MTHPRRHENTARRLPGVWRHTEKPPDGGQAWHGARRGRGRSAARPGAARPSRAGRGPGHRPARSRGRPSARGQRGRGPRGACGGRASARADLSGRGRRGSAGAGTHLTAGKSLAAMTAAGAAGSAARRGDLREPVTWSGEGSGLRLSPPPPPPPARPGRLDGCRGSRAGAEAVTRRLRGTPSPRDAGAGRARR